MNIMINPFILLLVYVRLASKPNVVLSHHYIYQKLWSLRAKNWAFSCFVLTCLLHVIMQIIIMQHMCRNGVPFPVKSSQLRFSSLTTLSSVTQINSESKFLRVRGAMISFIYLLFW